MLKILNKYGPMTFLIILMTLLLIFVPDKVMASATDILGPVTPPEAVANANAASGGEIGALFLFSRFVRLASIAAGIFVIWNFISAGFTYISGAGNANTHVVVRDKITWSVVGIIVLVSAYTIIGLLSLFFFRDAAFMLNPTLQGPI